MIFSFQAFSPSSLSSPGLKEGSFCYTNLVMSYTFSKIFTGSSLPVKLLFQVKVLTLLWGLIFSPNKLLASSFWTCRLAWKPTPPLLSQWFCPSSKTWFICEVIQNSFQVCWCYLFSTVFETNFSYIYHILWQYLFLWLPYPHSPRLSVPLGQDYISVHFCFFTFKYSVWATGSDQYTCLEWINKWREDVNMWKINQIKKGWKVNHISYCSSEV